MLFQLCGFSLLCTLCNSYTEHETLKLWFTNLYVYSKLAIESASADKPDDAFSSHRQWRGGANEAAAIPELATFLLR